MSFRWIDHLLLLAQNGKPAQQPAGQQTLFSLPFLLITLMLVFYVIVLRPQRREQRTRQHMLVQLKKNDRVVTVGGIYGVVTNVRADADEVTLKVDESSNAKLKVTLASIARLVGEEPAADSKLPS